MRLFKRKYLKSLTTIIILGTVLVALVGCFDMGKPAPLLDVTLQGNSTLIFAPEPEYYRIFENGQKQKIKQYDQKAGVYYRLELDSMAGTFIVTDGVSTEIVEQGDIINTAKAVLNLFGFAENSSIKGCKIYLFDDRCFVVVFDSPETDDSNTSTIYEYFPEDDKVEKIITFVDELVNDLQLVR